MNTHRSAQLNRFLLAIASFGLIFFATKNVNKALAVDCNTLALAGGHLVNASCDWAAGTYDYTGLGTITITNNATATAQGNTGAGTGVVIIADSLTIDSGSSISANGQGYAAGASGQNGAGAGGGGGFNGCGGAGAGGGGYGGVGASGTGGGAGGGNLYGSYILPLDLGSGGGSNTCVDAGGSGGGAISITASGTITVTGNITANGTNAPNNGGGGGSGGSIYLKAATLTGNGSITANGGTGGGAGLAGGGGGSGGRISLVYSTSNALGGTITASAALGPSNTTVADAGTIHTSGIPVASTLTQFKADGITSMPTPPSATNELDATFKVAITGDPDNPTNLTPQVEVRPLGTSFSNIPNYVGPDVAYSGSPVTGVVSVTGDGDGWYSDVSWTKRKKLAVTNYSGSAQSNIPVKLTVTYDADMNADFSDLRFTNTAQTLLDYWVETYTASTTATVWVEIDTLSINTTYIYMYYGNAGASTASNGTNTFQFFDDFSGVAVDTNKWTVTDATGWSVSGGNLVGTSSTGRLTSVPTFSDGVIMQTKAAYTTENTSGFMIGGFFSTTNNNFGYLKFPTTNDYFRNDSAWVATGTSVPPSSTNFLTYIKVKSASKIDFLVENYSTGADYHVVSNISNAVSSEPVVLGKRYDNGNTGETYAATWDWLFVRKYLAQDPAISYDAEEAVASYGLADGTSYHWQSRVCDSTGDCTDWASYGVNTEAEADFTILLNSDPDAPSNLGPASLTSASSYINDTTPTPTFDISDFDTNDSVKFQILIDDSADFGSLIVDYTSDFAVEPYSASFTVGQAAGSGTYATGNAGQTLSDGAYYWKVRAIDDSAAASSWAIANSGSVAFNVDTVGPSGPTSVTSSDHTASVWSADPTITMTWTAATVSGASLSGYSYIFDTSASTDPDTTQDIGLVTTVTSGSLASGNSHYFHIRAVDNIGNWGSAVHAGPYYIDTTAPTVPGTPATTTPTGDTTPTWAFTASTDSGSGLATNGYSVQWCTDSSYTGCGANVATSTTNSYTHSVALAGGTWYIKVKAIDAVGNESAYTSNGSVFIDAVPPTVSLTALTPDPTDDSTPTISGTATDTDTAISSVEYQVDSTSGSWTACIASDGTFNALSEAFTCTTTSLTDGSHTIYVRATDTSSNVSSNASDTFVVDVTPPDSFSLKSPSDNAYINDKTPNFKWARANDDTAGLDFYRVVVDDETLIDDIDPSDPGGDHVREDDEKWVKYGDDYIEAHSKINKLASGDRVWKVKAFDLAGNPRTSSSRDLTVDTKSPELKLTEVGGNKGLKYSTDSSTTAFTTTDTTPVFKGISDSGAVVKVYEGSTKLCDSDSNSESLWDCTSGKSLSYGNHEIKITSEDKAGNITKLPKFTLVISKGSLELTVEPGVGVTELTPEAEKKKEEVSVPAVPNPGKTHTLKLKLVDENRKPLPGVKVTLFSEPKEAITDVEGVATFNGVENGDHKLVLNSKEFSGEKKITVSGDSLEVDLTVQVRVANPLTSPIVLGLVGFLVAVIAFLLYKLKTRS